jgi:hypothetical protein
LAEDIDTGQCSGNEQRLDFGRGGKFKFSQRSKDGWPDAQGGKRFGNRGMFSFVGHIGLEILRETPTN